MTTAVDEEALYLRDGNAFVGTLLTQGGWDPKGANGGTVLALLGQCLDEVPSLVPMTVSRVTADLVRPVPIGVPLHVTSSVLREGKKIQLVELVLRQGDVEHVRVSALRLRDEDLSAVELPPSTTVARPAEALPPPEQATSIRTLTEEVPGFLRAVDMRRATATDGSGEGCWIRLMVPVVAGEPVSTTARLTVTVDYVNLIGVAGHPGNVTLINPDVSAHLLRAPRSEWVAVTGATRFNGAMGRGVSTGTLSDGDGVFGVASVSQLIQPR